MAYDKLHIDVGNIGDTDVDNIRDKNDAGSRRNEEESDFEEIKVKKLLYCKRNNVKQSGQTQNV